VIGTRVVGNKIEGYSCRVQVLLVNSLSNHFELWLWALREIGRPQTFSNCVLSLTVKTTLIAQRILFCSSREAARYMLILDFGYLISTIEFLVRASDWLYGVFDGTCSSGLGFYY
jgi:hypothetical protein